MYDAMKDAVEDVSGAISDVREMLQDAAISQRSRDLVEDTNDDWRVEWLREVDKLLKMDAGWGWEEFFNMIARNIDPSSYAAPVRLFIF